MKVLIVEDEDYRLNWFLDRIGNCDIAKDVQTAINFLTKNTYDYIMLDHDLNGYLENPSESTGYEVAKFIAGTPNEKAEIIVHTVNPAGAQAICSILPNAKPLPFGTFDVTKVGSKPNPNCPLCD